MARIAFIGLGNMGLPMALNLLKAGHALSVFDLSPEAVEQAVAQGAEKAGSSAEAVHGVEAVITMLPAGRHVREVYGGPSGIIAAAATGTLLIDCSTIDVESARAVAAEAARTGHAMLDAPVSGGVAGAAAATLTFMAGGTPEAFERARPLLQTMGKAVIHAGGSGNGQAAKICNNLILGISMIGVCESFVLAEKLGLDHQTLFDIASKASGQCWSLTTYCPVPGPVPTSPANRGYKPGFTAAMMLKDLRLAAEAATATGCASPMGAEAARVYAAFEAAGGAASDFSGIIEMLRDGRTV